MNPAFKYVYHKFVNSPGRWHPILAVYYLTYRCDFRCPYCSNGFNKPYYQLSHKVLEADEVMAVLARIRLKCDYIVITGGEPLQHPEFLDIIARIGEIGFREVALNTNGVDAHLYMPEIARSVDTLIFSLDTLDEEKADRWFGRGRGVFRKILSNIGLAASYPGRKYRIIISSVATPDNIPDMYEVYDFARSNGFTFAACPELRGVKPPPALLDSSAYRDFFDFLIDEKKKGRSVYGFPEYLRHMRDFRKFSCRPFTMLVVDPLGHVFYPCLEIGHTVGNILDCEDLHALRKEGASRFGLQPDCDVQCHSACALGFSLIFQYPLSIIHELYFMVKNVVHSKWWLKKSQFP